MDEGTTYTCACHEVTIQSLTVPNQCDYVHTDRNLMLLSCIILDHVVSETSFLEGVDSCLVCIGQSYSKNTDGSRQTLNIELATFKLDYYSCPAATPTKEGKGVYVWCFFWLQLLGDPPIPFSLAWHMRLVPIKISELCADSAKLSSAPW